MDDYPIMYVITIAFDLFAHIEKSYLYITIDIYINLLCMVTIMQA